ncbi:MAG TPA: PTS fructose-like transporter subunit IIB [Chloroflexaceae bacterium]|nr:PTS fructose-like transporter subunit IIB [Chloroflexaceae bacterium]
MSRIVAITACPTGVAHTLMAAEALRKTAAAMGHQISVETQGSEGARNVLSQAEIDAADVVLLATDIGVDRGRFAGKPVYETRTSEAITKTRAVLEAALALAPAAPVTPAASAAVPAPAAAPAASAVAPAIEAGPKRLVGITSCPTGIAHTFMAAEALQKGAKALGHTIKVETQGSVGAQNALTPEEIAAADAVVIAADTKIDLGRFAGKPVYETSTKAAIHDGAAVVRTALSEATVRGGASLPGSQSLTEQVAAAKAARSAGAGGPYKHLMTGVSYMLPFVVAGGLLIALAFAFGGIYVYEEANQGTFGWALFQIGAPSAFALMVPILSGFIAYSIADRPGLAPGMIGGMLAASTGAGFLGGIISGFIAGYSVAWLNRALKLPPTLAGLKPVLILPLLGAAFTGLLMVYVVGGPASAALNALTAWLTAMQTSGAVVLGLILGGMMAVDMGGPVNKSAYAFATGLLASELYTPMAAVMAAGMTPPLGLALATFLFKNRFNEEEREAGKAAAVLGISFITEGAIPFAAKDPLRVIPAIITGSAITGALSMLFGATLRVPHGGIFVLPIPNAVGNLAMYVVAILVGTLVTAAMLYVLKRPLVAAPDAPDGTVERQAVTA